MSCRRYPLFLLLAGWPLLALLALPALPALAQLPAPLLVADHTPGSLPFTSTPREIAVAGGLLYFTADDPQHGREPWVSDGTAAGTRRLADLCPGTCSGHARAFAAVGERVVFLASPGVGTSLFAIERGEIREIASGLGERAEGFDVLGEVAYFEADLPGPVPMRTDGTAAGTRRTGDFCGGDSSCSGYIRKAAASGGIYFTNDGALQLLTAEGNARRLAALDVFSELTQLDLARVVFQGCREGACAAHVSNGTAAGTFPLESFRPQAEAIPRRFVAWRGRAYFAVPGGGLLSSDGTAAGTRAETGFTGEAPTPFAALPEVLLYTEYAPAAAVNILRARRADGGDQPLTQRVDLEFVILAAGKVFFSSNFDLAATDGSPGGTVLFGRGSSPDPGAAYRGAYYYAFNTPGIEIGATLWRSDGTLAGTAALEIPGHPAGTRWSSHPLGGSLGAHADSVDWNRLPDLYLVDPHTLAVRDPSPLRIHPLAYGADRLFALDLGGGGLIALREDGSSEVLLERPAPGGTLADDGHFFFTPTGPGQQLYESDGTAAGTRLLFDLDPSYDPVCYGNDYCDPLYPGPPVMSGSNAFFLAPAADGSEQLALWVYRRGAPAPAQPAELLRLGAATTTPVAAPGGRVIFDLPGEEFNGVQIPALWSSDGTVAGTLPFFEFSDGGRLGRAVETGGRVYFTRGLYRPELWATDLTAEGTRRLLATDGYGFSELAAARDGVYFSGYSATGADPELGFSDGTADGTRWLEKVPGRRGLEPQGLFVLDDGRVIFSGAGDEAGRELWISDSTLAGTRRLTDLAPGPAASNPARFAQIGARIFFEADDGTVGSELWALDLPPDPPPTRGGRRPRRR